MMSSLKSAQKAKMDIDEKKNEDQQIEGDKNDKNDSNANKDPYQFVTKALKETCPNDWETYLKNFKSEEVTDKDVRDLEPSDINELIPKMGPRNRFKKWLKANKSIVQDITLLDIVFCMDCTSSMSSYIKKGKESIMDIVDKVKKAEKVNVQFAYVAYRDHPPQDTTFITKVHPFTNNTQEMKKYISLYKAHGGGDGPEAVTAALHDALHAVKYRPNAIKIVVLIADAPPHGLGCSGDGFPNGDPNGLDCVKIAKEMASKGIILYVIACEPALSEYKLAHDLMAGLAQITEGRYLPLTGSHLLPDVIIGGAQEEVSLKKLESFVQNNMDKLKKENPNMSSSEMNKIITSKMKDHGYNWSNNTIDSEKVYGNYNNSNINAWSNASSLSGGMGMMQNIMQPQANFAYQQQQQQQQQQMNYSSVNKLMNRVNNSNNNAYY